MSPTSTSKLEGKLRHREVWGMQRIWRTWLTLAFICCWSGHAAAIPVTVEAPWTQWQYDNALIVPSENYSYIGDCFSCVRNSYNNRYAVDTASGSAVSWNRWDSQTTLASSIDAVDFSYSARSEFHASVDSDLEGAYAAAGVGLYRFIVGFNVLEEVVYTGNTGLTLGGTDFFPSTPTVLSGAVLQPGHYFTSLFFPKSTVSASAGQSMQSSQDFAFNYSFTRVPTPASWALCLAGLLAVAATRMRRRRA